MTLQDEWDNKKDKMLYRNDPEYQELLALEYVLTWGYTDNLKQDFERYRELSERRWVGNVHISYFLKNNL